MHWRWFDKSKPPPPWLDLSSPLTVYPAKGGVRHRMQYYRTIWNATPPWANEDAVKAVYVKAHHLRLLGKDVNVDHIIPLHGVLVCGLHCEQNLRVVPRLYNAHLSNRIYPGCPQMELFNDLSHDESPSNALREAWMRKKVHAPKAPRTVPPSDQMSLLPLYCSKERRGTAASRTAKTTALPVHELPISPSSRDPSLLHSASKNSGRANRGRRTGVHACTRNETR